MERRRETIVLEPDSDGVYRQKRETQEARQVQQTSSGISPIKALAGAFLTGLALSLGIAGEFERQEERDERRRPSKRRRR